MVTNNHHDTPIAVDTLSGKEQEKLTTPVNFEVNQEKEVGDAKLLRNLINFVKQTGDFDYHSFEVEEDLSLSPEQEQRLMRLFIDHVKRTGECDYAMLLKIVELASVEKSIDDKQEQPLSLTPSQPIPSLKEQEIKETCCYLEEIKSEIIPTCLTFKTLLNQCGEELRPTQTTQTKTRLRMLMEQIPETADYSFLIYDLKLKHQQLTKYINRLVSLGYKYANALDTLPLNISRRSIAKVISDLVYIGLYIEENAQLTKIQQEIFLANDPSIYLRRLNQYLDILPELMAYLLHAFENLMASESLMREEEKLV